MLGAGLLWFGWYGFNAGSATSANGAAGSTFMTTTVATAAAMLGWLLTERIRDGHATSLGAASGIVAGLVAITPSCSSVNVVGALVVGVAAGVFCALAVGLKYRLALMIRSTWSECIWSAVWWERCWWVCWPPRRPRPSRVSPACHPACSTAADSLSWNARQSAHSVFSGIQRSSPLSWP
ncbi:ammonium Transporter family protein [Mycobacterium xenopi 4042]|uniref:Ammonium transporter n=1 Tax=Mycobacterium xenopi 4042 TaxID=1299334 RepID=X8E8J7_MYCXE|nr:ammonium Transporter family protein [Mycobacterium xenopi 4042]